MDELLQTAIAFLALINLISCGWAFYLLHLTGHPAPIFPDWAADWTAPPAAPAVVVVNPIVVIAIISIFAVFLVSVIAVAVAMTRGRESER